MHLIVQIQTLLRTKIKDRVQHLTLKCLSKFFYSKRNRLVFVRSYCDQRSQIFTFLLGSSENL